MKKVLHKQKIECKNESMKRITLDVAADTAKQMLSSLERQIAEKIRARNQLSGEINELEQTAETLRAQLQAGGAKERKPRGQNRDDIREYLKAVGDDGASLTEIAAAVGIGVSSAALTLKSNPNYFEFDAERKIWKLRYA